MAFVLTLALPLIPWIAAFFEFTRPTAAHLGLIVSLAVLYLVISEVVGLAIYAAQSSAI